MTSDPLLQNEELLSAVRRLFDFQRVETSLLPSEIIIGLGTHDLRVAERAAELYLAGYAPKILFTGGVGRNTGGLFGKSEAEAFAETAVQLGVPSKDVIIEPLAKNSGDNIRYSRKILQELGIEVGRAIFVQKPYMLLRVRATVRLFWPEVECLLTCPQLELTECSHDNFSFEDICHELVGDFQRVILYPAKGFQAAEPLSDSIIRDFNLCVRAGLVKQLIAA